MPHWELRYNPRNGLMRVVSLIPESGDNAEGLFGVDDASQHVFHKSLILDAMDTSNTGQSFVVSLCLDG